VESVGLKSNRHSRQIFQVHVDTAYVTVGSQSQKMADIDLHFNLNLDLNFGLEFAWTLASTCTLA